MIRFSKPDITEQDTIDIKKILKSGWLAHGKYTKKLEDLFSKFTGSKYAIAVSSCTAGLHISCLTAGFKKGDEVLVSSQTHTATGHAIEYTGAKPIFVDCNALNGNININDLKRKITKKTKGIIVVHMNGLPCEMDEINKIVKKEKIKLIEDCAHALGSNFKNKHCGTFGISGCFSFYPTKQITSGEGGMIITNDKSFYLKAKKMRAFGIDLDPVNRKIPGHYDVRYLGFNYRMTDFQACLAYKQLTRYGRRLKLRKKNANLYFNLLKKNELILQEKKFPKNCSFFLYQIILKSKLIRKELMEKLNKKKIGYSIHYAKPVPLMKYYKVKYNIKTKEFSKSNFYSERVLSLPVNDHITSNQIKYICNIINKL